MWKLITSEFSNWNRAVCDCFSGDDQSPVHGADVSGWLRDGKLFHTETVVDGLDQAPTAFINLLRGHNTGKMIVRL